MAAIDSSRSYFEKSGADGTALTGTVASSSTTLTGTTTAFDTELFTGDVIREDGTTDFLIVVSIASATSAVVHQAPTTAMSGATVDPLTWSQVSASFNASGPSPQATKIDTTSWDSGGFAEFIAGRIDSGEFTATLFFQPKVTAHANMISDLNDKTRRAWRLWWNDSAAGTVPSSTHDESNSRVTFIGDIGGFDTSTGNDAAVESTLTVFITGKSVVSAGTDA